MDSKARVTQQDIVPSAVKSRHIAQGAFISVTVVTKTSAYTANTDDTLILCNATTAAFTVTLPSAKNISGRSYIVKKTDSTANAITIATSSSQTIDGASTKSLASQYKYMELLSDGSNWFIVANNQNVL